MAKTIEDMFTDIQTRLIAAAPAKNYDVLTGLSWEARELLNQAPENPAVLFLIGTIDLQLGSYGSAIALIHRAIEIEPEFSEAYNNLGSCWKMLHKTEKAFHWLSKGLALKPDSALLNNLGTLFINNGNPESGIPYLEQSIALAKNEPERMQPIWNMSLLQLETGNLEDGFHNYDAGLFCGDRWLKKYRDDLPYWDGSPGKKVLIYDEQGLGDRILFAGLLNKLQGRNEVALDVHHRLEGLYRRSFPWITEIYPNAKDEKAPWHETIQVDAVCAMPSLAKFFWKKYEDISRFPYLLPDNQLCEQWRARIMELGPPPYIGIAWTGGIHKTQAHDRSIKLASLKEILLEGATYISLQYTEEAENKIARNNVTSDIKIHYIPEITDGKLTYDHTAAIVSYLDLCIVPNTTIVHLCGAMAKKCWTWTPLKKAWRYYGPDKDTLPWYYPSVKMYNQEVEGTWEPTFTRLHTDLENLIPDYHKAYG